MECQEYHFSFSERGKEERDKKVKTSLDLSHSMILDQSYFKAIHQTSLRQDYILRHTITAPLPLDTKQTFIPKIVSNDLSHFSLASSLPPSPSCRCVWDEWAERSLASSPAAGSSRSSLGRCGCAWWSNWSQRWPAEGHSAPGRGRTARTCRPYESGNPQGQETPGVCVKQKGNHWNVPNLKKKKKNFRSDCELKNAVPKRTQNPTQLHETNSHNYHCKTNITVEHC